MFKDHFKAILAKSIAVTLEGSLVLTLGSTAGCNLARSVSHRWG